MFGRGFMGAQSHLGQVECYRGGNATYTRDGPNGSCIRRTVGQDGRSTSASSMPDSCCDGPQAAPVPVSAPMPMPVPIAAPIPVAAPAPTAPVHPPEVQCPEGEFNVLGQCTTGAIACPNGDDPETWTLLEVEELIDITDTTREMVLTGRTLSYNSVPADWVGGGVVELSAENVGCVGIGVADEGVSPFLIGGGILAALTAVVLAVK